MWPWKAMRHWVGNQKKTTRQNYSYYNLHIQASSNSVRFNLKISLKVKVQQMLPTHDI